MIVYTDLLDRVVADIAATVEGMGHIDPRRVVCLGTTRSAGGKWGDLAECIALGLPEEATFEFTYYPHTRRLLAATPWFIPRNRRLILQRRRMLYVLRFYFPRFLENGPLDSLAHELLHISESFDGAHRPLRHGRTFDRRIREIRLEWLRKGDPSLIEAIQMSFAAMRRRHGAVVCRCFRDPFRTPLRLPAGRPRSLMKHPDIQRLGLSLGPTPPRPIEMKFDDPAELEVTEKSLEYRLFHPGGSERLAPELVRPAASRSDGALFHPDAS